MTAALDRPFDGRCVSLPFSSGPHGAHWRPPTFMQVTTVPDGEHWVLAECKVCRVREAVHVRNAKAAAIQAGGFLIQHAAESRWRVGRDNPATWCDDWFEPGCLGARVQVVVGGQPGALLELACFADKGWCWCVPLDRYRGKLRDGLCANGATVKTPREGATALWRKLSPRALRQMGDHGVMP